MRMPSKKRQIRTGRVAALTGLTLATFWTALPGQAGAASLPFADPNAQGAIGLCDQAGHPIQAGSTLNHPFAIAAGSTVPAPPGYDAKAGGKATLYAFQPRKDVDPGQWSGYQLTGGSIYADANHPLVSGTNIDPSLQDFATTFPVKWDGLVELRIYYTAPNKVVFRRSYPAAVLRVQGNRWTVVQAAQLDCDLTKVVSSERQLLPASAFDPAHPAVTDAPQLASRTTAVAPSSAHSASRPAAAPSRSSSSASAPAAAQSSLSTIAEASHRGASSSSGPWLVVLLAGVGIAGIAAAVGWRARQRGQH